MEARNTENIAVLKSVMDEFSTITPFSEEHAKKSVINTVKDIIKDFVYVLQSPQQIHAGQYTLLATKVLNGISYTSRPYNHEIITVINYIELALSELLD